MYKKELLAVRDNVVMLDKYQLSKNKSKTLGKAIHTIHRSFKRLEID